MESMAISKKGRKVMRFANDHKLNKAANFWFVQKTTQDMPVSGPSLQKSCTASCAVLHKGDSEPLFSYSFIHIIYMVLYYTC